MKKKLKIIIAFFKKHPRKTIFSFLLLFSIYWFSLPAPLFQVPTSYVLEDKQGNLLGAKIAKDGQWRFPFNKNVPEKFQTAIIEFEDRRFFNHPGIDPIGIGRAFKQNIANKKIVSGGSTISMQVVRMAMYAKTRNIFQKLLEMVLATRLEIKYSKKEILAFYASNAPFGGNVVGLDAASWRYFGKQANLLSWSEAATLAVLPNSPALIHPGRNRNELLAKRNRLLKRLFDQDLIDKLTFQLALEEPLPAKPLPLPRLAPHLLEKARRNHAQNKSEATPLLKSTIDMPLQNQIGQILNQHNQLLKHNGIHNIAALVMEVETGNILSYHGNVENAGAEHSEAVDIIQAPRSTGSILKPFLYALMIHEGKILPNSLISDVPIYLNGFSPENFHENYDGLVIAKRALVRSLNIPFVNMLQDYGLEKFHFSLQKMGFHSINKTPNHYGLTLILGGAESSLWEITNAYAYMSRALNHFQEYNGEYNPMDFRSPNYQFSEGSEKKDKQELQKEAPIIGAAAIWETFEAMRTLERPTSEGEWKEFNSSKKVAWKTGTSFGFRDAWAVGTTPEYTVGIWVGNADGEGRPGLVGVKAAAPILFDIFDLLPSSQWFLPPYDEIKQVEVCQKSGYLATSLCDKVIVDGNTTSEKLKHCPFHKMIHLDKSQKWQVTNQCLSPNEMVHQPWFVLPPIEEFYYKSRNPSYKPLPNFMEGCKTINANNQNPMELIYPKDATKIYVPVDLNGNLSRTVFQIAHRQPGVTIYWHLNNEYLGSTNSFHNFELNPDAGHHILSVVDENGFRMEKEFEILEK